MRLLILIHACQAGMSGRVSVIPVFLPIVARLSMAKSAAKFDHSSAQRVKLDPFNGILGIFFVVVACILPVAMPASDGRLNVLHHVGIALSCLLAALFFWRWLRAQLAHAMRNETEEEVSQIRATTFAQDEQARKETASQQSSSQETAKT